jgi:hypothetical protein
LLDLSSLWRALGVLRGVVSENRCAEGTIAVNASNFEPTAIAAARVRHMEGGSTGRYLD